MRLLVVNPNTTASMTALVQEHARAVAGPGVRVDAVSPATGPAAIEGHADEARSVPGLLDEVERGEAAGYHGFVVACFGDPGLLAAREVATGPVVGIAEAGMRTASYLGRTFSVVTTLGRTVPHAAELARTYVGATACAGVHACEVPVLGLESDPTAYGRVLDTCRAALLGDRSDVVVLGCAGMAGFAQALSADLSVPVVEPVTTAVLAVESLVRLGLSTAKLGELARPVGISQPV